jgi:hypothetical protein
MTDIANMTRAALSEAFDAAISEEAANGLVDVKFCVERGGVAEDAMRQFLYIIQMDKEEKTRPYSDY